MDPSPALHVETEGDNSIIGCLHLHVWHMAHEMGLSCGVCVDLSLSVSEMQTRKL